MADFNYYLNRAGIRGLQGVKGDQGDSPIITVQSETPNEYILKITNPDGTELLSPNLRGNKININEGTYVRYNTETGELYTSTADGATGELAGVVRLATDADIADMDERAAVTPSQLADALSKYLTSPDGSVKIVQSADSSLTELTVESTGQDIDQLKSDVSTLQNEVSVLNTEIDTKSPKLTQGDNITLTPQDDGTIKISSTGGAAGDVTAAGDNKFTGKNTFTGEVNIAGAPLTVDGLTTLNQAAAQYLNVTSITSPGEINAVSIKTNGLRSDDIQTTEGKKYLTEADVDNQTIQVVEGKLHANLDELGNEVNTLSGELTDLTGRVTANEADILKKQNELTAGSNITLTDNEDGTTTIAAESSVPTNMVTTDTEQTITGKKSLPLSTTLGRFSFGVEGFDDSIGKMIWTLDNGDTAGLDISRYHWYGFLRNGQKVWWVQEDDTNNIQKWMADKNNIVIKTARGNGLKVVGKNDGVDLELTNETGDFTFLRSKDVDGSTITFSEGVLKANIPSVNVATTETAGIVKPDGSTITVAEDGTIAVDNTEIEEQIDTKQDKKLFDKSKFTIVGSPTITDDGVASGFSKSNYLIAPVKANLLNSFSAECSFTYKTKDQESIIWCYNLNCYLSINKTNFSLKYPTGTSSESSTSTFLSIPLTDVDISGSDVVHSKVTLSPSKISLTINNIVKELDVNINWGYLQRITSTSGIRLGNANAFQEKYYFTGLLDLKQFSITVDGKEVFSGSQDIYQLVNQSTNTIDGGNATTTDVDAQLIELDTPIVQSLPEESNLASMDLPEEESSE